MRTMEGKRVTVGMILRLITTDVGLNKHMYDIFYLYYNFIQNFIPSCEKCLDPDQLSSDDKLKNMTTSEWIQFFLCIYWEKFKKSSCQKLL